LSLRLADMRGAQMPQLVRIAHYVKRPNDAALNLERRSLDGSLLCVDNYTGQTVNGGKAQREVLSPAFACGRAPAPSVGAILMSGRPPLVRS